MFISRMQLMMAALIAFCSVSCTDTNESPNSLTDSTGADTVATDAAPPQQNNRNKSVVLQVVDELPALGPLASFNIMSTKVVADSLHLKVEYTGGCEDHVFTAFWAPIWLEENPASTEILISHDDKGDLCEAVKGNVLMIDLKPLKEKAKGGSSDDNQSEVTLTLVVNGERVAHVPYRF